MCVLVVGLPFGPLEKLSEKAYYTLLPLGLDVSMTPFTYDMSMWSTEESQTYSKKIDIILFSNHSKTIVDPKDLKFYNHKIPIILYYEMLYYNMDIVENKYALCHEFQKLLDIKITGFQLFQAKVEKNDLYKGFNETIYCF